MRHTSSFHTLQDRTHLTLFSEDTAAKYLPAVFFFSLGTEEEKDLPQFTGGKKMRLMYSGISV